MGLISLSLALSLFLSLCSSAPFIDDSSPDEWLKQKEESKVDPRRPHIKLLLLSSPSMISCFILVISFLISLRMSCLSDSRSAAVKTPLLLVLLPPLPPPAAADVSLLVKPLNLEDRALL